MSKSDGVGRTSLGGAPRGLSVLLILAHDVVVSTALLSFAILARYRLAAKPVPAGLFESVVPAAVVVFAVVFPVFRLHRGLWRYTAANDLLRAAKAVAAAMLVLLVVVFLENRLQDVPRSTPLIAAPLIFLGLAFGRLVREAATHGDLQRAFTFEDRTRPSAVVLADSAAAARFLKSLRAAPGARLRVSGLVTVREKAMVGRLIHGAEILGELDRIGPIMKALAAAEGAPPELILAEPRPSRDLVETAIAAASAAGGKVSITGGDRASRPHPVRPADLLDRPPRRLDPAGPRSLLAGRRILVTGAGGTIGGELTRQVLKFDPERVILLDASEFNLYAIDRELTESGAPRRWTVELGDVRDRRRVFSLMESERPDVILHAAALKHVPLMELNPCEAVLTNVMGAVNVVEAARDHAAALVFISTDKAVNPTNVMGATKRVAERAVQALSRGRKVTAAAVRFGNVLGSTGSVVPLFERQIRVGGPVTVTDPAIERFFMTVEEAASLVLQAASLPCAPEDQGSGRIFVLDMGEPVRIDDLARQMIRLNGLRPDEDVKIVYTGLRPGEKLYEEIFYDAETVTPTGVDGVLAAAEPLPDWDDMKDLVAALTAAAERRDEPETIRLLRALVPVFRRD